VEDDERTTRVLSGIVGKRLTYRDSVSSGRRWRVGVVPERITITVRASGAHPDVLTIQDAMRQVLEYFRTPYVRFCESARIEWKLANASTNSRLGRSGGRQFRAEC